MATRTSSCAPPATPSGLVGYRYLLGVTLLVAVSTVATLLAVVAGVAALTSSAPSAEPGPFATYPARCDAGRPGQTCPRHPDAGHRAAPRPPA